jgi:hypothetical protein
MSILEMLTEQLGGDAIQQISRQVGADPDATAKAVSGALPMLVTALARNSTNSQGAGALASALDRDHDGSILDDVAGFLGGGGGGGAGAAILGHILGGQQSGAQDALGQMSGLKGGQIGQILATLAPLVMGALGRQKQQSSMGASQITDLLRGEQKKAESAAPDMMGMLGKLLDSNNDGSVGDDLARIGMGMLGNLFGGKR